MKIKLAENFWYAAGEDGAIHAVDTEENADTFKTMGDASQALEKARKYPAFKNAEIVEKNVLIQTYANDKWFVSTVRRKYSAAKRANTWYYEVVVRKWNPEKRESGKIYQTYETADSPDTAIHCHNGVCYDLIMHDPEKAEG